MTCSVLLHGMAKRLPSYDPPIVLSSPPLKLGRVAAMIYLARTAKTSP